MSTLGEQVWNGPFYASTAPDPVTVGWVFLKILETLWRFFVTLVGIAVVCGGLIWLFTKDNVPLSQQVKATLLLNAPECKSTPNNPVKLTLFNRSASNVASVSVAYHAYAMEQSTDLAVESTNTRSYFDGVIAPKDNIYYCLERPALSQQPSTFVTYSAEVLSAEPTSDAYNAGRSGTIWAVPPGATENR